MKELNEFDEILDDIEAVEEYEEQHPDQDYDIELIDAKSGVFGVGVRGKMAPSSGADMHGNYEIEEQGEYLPSYVSGLLDEDSWYGLRHEDGKIIIEILDGKSAGTQSHDQ